MKANRSDSPVSGSVQEADPSRHAENVFRARRFRERIAAKGYTLAEFGRQAGITRNVLYGLSKGRVPKPDVQKTIVALLGADL